jgi:hypothetical protein
VLRVARQSRAVHASESGVPAEGTGECLAIAAIPRHAKREGADAAAAARRRTARRL